VLFLLTGGGEGCSLGSFSGVRMDAWIKSYLTYCRASGVCEHTIKAKLRHLTIFSTCSQKDLNLDSVFSFIDTISKKYSPDVVWRIKMDLRMFLKYLDESGKCKISWNMIKNSRPEHKVTIEMTKDEFELIDKSLDKSKKRIAIKWRAMHNILWTTGLRRAEIMRINLSDVDHINGVINVKLAKGGKWSERLFTYDLTEYLETFKPKKYLFEGCYNTAQVMIYTMTKQCGIKRPLKVHSYRSGCITFLSEMGMTIQQISKYIGHERIETTMRYDRTESSRVLANVSRCYGKKPNVRIKTLTN
jgi:site-specific recombinase XerD